MTLADLSIVDTDGSAETNADRAYEIVRERLVMLDIRPGEPIIEVGEESIEIVKRGFDKNIFHQTIPPVPLDLIARGSF